MLPLGSKVVFIEDQFEQKLPIGEYGYIIAYDRNADNVFDYVVRVPALNRNFAVPEEDIELEVELIKQEAEKVEKAALIDYALATHNEKLFHYIMNGEEEEASEEQETTPMNGEEFIRQINLKAWI
ncbi:ATPase [Paenibacillus septentrionalis]|uniref:ATPase n=1 Tax=Paenibacillus septentrionalis TaxID=429342 RepID=A0ABW1VA04_9BACL